MKYAERQKAIALRSQGYSIKTISGMLGVANSSVSVWVREIEPSSMQVNDLRSNPFTNVAIERRRASRLNSERTKRELIIDTATADIPRITKHDLWLMGVMLYWAEGGKTQRMVRFSNADPEMIKIMMHFFRDVCTVPEEKFRGYIHIHPHLDSLVAERYWQGISKIQPDQFFKTYRKQNISSQNKKDTLPYGVMDIYVLDTTLFLKISGWAKGIFANH